MNTNRGALCKSLISSCLYFSFFFGINVGWVQLDPQQSLAFCENGTFQKWSLQENRSETGMLTGGFCRDLIQFSASKSPVKIYLKSLLRKTVTRWTSLCSVREWELHLCSQCSPRVKNWQRSPCFELSLAVIVFLYVSAMRRAFLMQFGYLHVEREAG